MKSNYRMLIIKITEQTCLRATSLTSLLRLNWLQGSSDGEMGPRLGWQLRALSASLAQDPAGPCPWC